MRTTIDIPDDLLRRAKAFAALRGMKLKDLVASLLENGLANPAQSAAPATGHRQPIPVTIAAKGRKIPVLTNAEIFEILDRDDDETHGRLS